MMNYVVMTHYQLMYSLMHAYTYNKGNARLFISSDYINFDNIKTDEILTENIFNEVRVFDTKLIQQDFFTELNTEYPTNAFEEVLENHFKNIFGHCHDETFYIFNEFQLYYYYVEKYASDIIIVEDGYGSYIQQSKILCFKGQYKEIDPFIGKVFPSVHATSKKVSKYLVNEEVEPLAKHKDIIEIVDFKTMEHEIGKKKLLSLYSRIYNFPTDIKNNSALLLTQPLKRANYCRTIDQMKLYKKIIMEELSKYEYIYIKPHPADDVGYEFLVNDRIKLLSSDFPIEIFNYTETNFEISYTFGSTASKISGYSKESVSLYNRPKSTHNQIARFISNYVRKVKIDILHVITLEEDFDINFEICNKNVKSDDFVFNTIILNNTKKSINTKYVQYQNTDVYDILNDYSFEYVFFTTNHFKIESDILREISYYFRNNYADTISTFSSFIVKNKGVYYEIAADKKSLLHNMDNIIVSAGIALKNNISKEFGVFKSIDYSRNVDLPLYFVNKSSQTMFEDYIIDTCNKKACTVDDFLFQTTLLKIALVKKFKIDSFNVDNDVLVKTLRENVFVNDLDLLKIKMLKNTYLKIYDKLKLEKIIKKLRNSVLQAFYFKIKSKFVK